MPGPIEQLLDDKEFHAVPLGNRLAMLRDNYPEFANLSTKDQGEIVARAQQRSMGISEPEKFMPQSGPFGKALQGVSDFAQGALANGLKTVYGGGDLIRQATGLPRIINTPEVQKVITPPPSTAGRAGSATGEVMQYLAPGARVGAGLVERMATAGAQSGALSAAQSDSPKQGAVTATVTAAVPAAVEGLKFVAPPVKALANKIYQSGLLRGGGDKADKIIAKDAAPELIKRGVTAFTEGGLSRGIQDNLQAAGQEVSKVEDDIVNRGAWTAKRSVPGTPTVNMTPPSKVDFRAVVDDYRRAMNDKFMVGGKVLGGMENEYAAYQKILKDLMSRGAEPDFSTAIRMRRLWDQTVAEAKGFQRPDLAASKEAMRDAANSIRRELGRAYPELAKANSEYSLWANANQVVENTAERKSGHGFGVSGPLAMGAGAIAGAAHGGTAEGAVLGMALGGLDQLLKSTAVRTMEPIAMDRLANALSKGKYEDALKVIAAEVSRFGAPSPGTRALPPPQ